MLRIATTLDARLIAKLHVKSWHETYTRIINQTILDSLSVDEKEQLWKIILDDPNQLILVYEKDNEIIGFADFYMKPNCQNGELKAIYILKAYQGKGVGQLFIQQGFKYLKQKGYQSITLEVLNKNLSRFFYEKLGAKCIGEVSAEDMGEGLKDLIYEWKI
ncbi:GNAT family N-acetyltransferase [Acinetobacter equi]|uniref:N-acetyltransferase domain-containing protein n=1 Tax=Acinetobacter equi TaxID=1324350 RepID=A0A0N9V4Y6_9GAMM|nr:GNAT family N-acetyltransferase [Acinetobacter equi]ALH94290.1 hypothetical protein AOY20_01330 [Acinetobacter equi]